MFHSGGLKRQNWTRKRMAKGSARASVYKSKKRGNKGAKERLKVKNTGLSKEFRAGKISGKLKQKISLSKFTAN